jgi:hypothetical protein
MDEELKERLREKGWLEIDINKADSIMAGAAQKSGTGRIDLFVYWTALIISIVLNIVVSGVILPMMFMIHGLALIAFVLVIALFFGWIFYILVKDIENMETHHYIIAGIFIPAVALVNVFVIVNIGNRIIQLSIPQLLNIPLSNPLQLSIVYAIGFTVPYLLSQLKRKS